MDLQESPRDVMSLRSWIFCSCDEKQVLHEYQCGTGNECAVSDLSSKFSKLVRICLLVQATREMWVQSLGQEDPLE